MAEKIRSREEIAREDTWAMEDLYASDAAWLEDLEKLKTLGREAPGVCREAFRERANAFGVSKAGRGNFGAA